MKEELDFWMCLFVRFYRFFFLKKKKERKEIKHPENPCMLLFSLLGVWLVDSFQVFC